MATSERGRPLKILSSPLRACNTCSLELPLWTEFYKSGKSVKTGEQWYARICKSCDYQLHEVNRVRDPDINRRAVKRYQAKRKRSKDKRCLTCPSVIVNNPSGFCLNCYILMWIRCQWRVFNKHWLGDTKAAERREQLRYSIVDLVQVMGVKTFPEYRLKHQKSVKFYPELAFTLGNIEWVPVNENLSRSHMRHE
jgi:hypothetical protein